MAKCFGIWIHGTIIRPLSIGDWKMEPGKLEVLMKFRLKKEKNYCSKTKTS